MKHMTQNGIAKLSKWEGEVKRDGLHVPYDDATGKPVRKGESYEGYLTIGHGHLLDRSELTSEQVIVYGHPVYYWDGITDQQAEFLLDEDIDWAEDVVNTAVKVPLNQNQFEALVSFTFNVGGTAFRSSTLLKKLNRGNYDEVPSEMGRWIRSGGRVVQGLVNRREKEIEHWFGNDSKPKKRGFLGRFF